ncbi:MAG: hypothetical protein ACK5YM_07075, partial [Pseudomonadota bacterium]
MRLEDAACPHSYPQFCGTPRKCVLHQSVARDFSGEALHDCSAAIWAGVSVAHRLSVAVETPRHSAVGGLLDYTSEQPLAPGTLLQVPLGRRKVPGIVWEPDARAPGAAPDLPEHDLRAVAAPLASLPPLDAEWRALVAFSAGYYQRGTGELALSVLPPELRKLDDVMLGRRLARLRQRVQREAAAGGAAAAPALRALTGEQQAALGALDAVLQAG